MKFSKLFVFILIIFSAFLACSTASAADHTVVWQDTRDGIDGHLYYKNRATTSSDKKVSNTNSNQIGQKIG